MTTQNNKSKEELNHQQARGKKSLVYGGVIVLLIAISPIIFYSYKSFPDGNVWKTSFFEITTSYGSWFDTAWYYSGKIVPLYLFLLWFFTCKHWWHWIILIPIAMYSFQLWSLINATRNFDEVELVYMFPFMMILIPFVYLIRAKLFSKIRGNDLEAFEQELTRKRTVWQQVIDLFR